MFLSKSTRIRVTFPGYKFSMTKTCTQRCYRDGGPGCFCDSGGSVWRQVIGPIKNKKALVLVGVFSYLLWGTCHGFRDPKYYVRIH